MDRNTQRGGVSVAILGVVAVLFGAVTLAKVIDSTDTGQSATASRANERAQDVRVFPLIELPAESRAEEAIARLGDKLPEVAAWYGYSPLQLRELMANERSLWVDGQGRLFYKDDHTVTSTEAGATAEGEMLTDSAIYPLEDTFTLHSNPGAKRVIYLDFDGMTLSGVSWNSYNGGNDIVAPAWDIDGDRTVFGETERIRIQNIWRRVAEDYAPFDVDVTTEQPPLDRIARTSSDDEYYGTLALVSPISGYFGNYGGLAYLGIFNRTNNTYYQPALVFPEKLANNAKYIAEAVSHETGHNVGLSHDGTTSGTEYYKGHGDWAPIMGNSYSRPITQWSRGEYNGANNTQDDLAVIASNGLPLRSDDYGDTRGEAGSFLYTGNTVFATGVIDSTSDTDVIGFTSDAGPVSFTVSTAAVAPDLNMDVALVDGSGQEIASAPPTTGSVTLNADLVPGQYYLVITGVGAGDPASSGYSAYASLGHYSAVGSIQYSGQIPPAAEISASPTSGNAPLSVQFAGDASTDPDGSIVSYQWNFGDNTTSAEMNPTKVYTTTGTFTVELTVTDNDGFSDSAVEYVTVSNAPPVAVLNANVTTGDLPLTVAFNGQDSYDNGGTVSSYQWDFGDGVMGQGSSVTHTYSTAGTYVAQLTVTDNEGATGADAVTIEVLDPNNVTAPDGLSASESGGTVSLSWNDRSSNESAFNVYRAIDVKRSTPVYELIGTVGAGVEQYTDVVPGTATYLYRVAAYRAISDTLSDYSNIVKVRVRNIDSGTDGGTDDGTDSGKPDKCQPWPKCR